jgi:hypothetical protein
MLDRAAVAVPTRKYRVGYHQSANFDCIAHVLVVDSCPREREDCFQTVANPIKFFALGYLAIDGREGLPW